MRLQPIYYFYPYLRFPSRLVLLAYWKGHPDWAEGQTITVVIILLVCSFFLLFAIFGQTSYLLSSRPSPLIPCPNGLTVQLTATGFPCADEATTTVRNGLSGPAESALYCLILPASSRCQLVQVAVIKYHLKQLLLNSTLQNS